MKKPMVALGDVGNMVPLRQARQALQEKYAWPGGYPLFAIMSDGEGMCVDCALKEWRYIYSSTKEHSWDGWRLEGVAVNWEDADMVCCHCGKEIESAYGERSMDNV